MLVTPTGSGVEIAVGNVTTKSMLQLLLQPIDRIYQQELLTVQAKASTLVSGDGSRINIADDSVLIKKWDGIVPGATQVWEPIQTSLG